MPESAPRTLQFFFEFASSYSYLSAMRIARAAAVRGLRIRYRPFLLGPIFAAQGWSDSPFNLYPAKGAYMWRDLERLCALDQIPFVRPSVFPRSGLLAARIATAHAEEPWLAAFVAAVYQANFGEDRDIGDAEVLCALLHSLDVDATQALGRAAAPETKAALRACGDEAAAQGIFGAPSFVTRGELFWGNDRLDQALAWATGER